MFDLELSTAIDKVLAIGLDARFYTGVCGSCPWERVFKRGGLVCFITGLPFGDRFGAYSLRSTQFIRCGEYRPAVKVSTCNNPPP